MSDEHLDLLGDYFVNMELEAKFGITFGQLAEWYIRDPWPLA